jgi:molybdopterin/thiamine biosynthesis adenylyltransferase
MRGSHWWESGEGKARLDYELSELARAGIPAVRDESAFASGIARLALSYPSEQKSEELYVTFPDFYPYFRFMVEGPGLRLDHHQNPFAKVLCILGRDNSWWQVGDTVAGVLQEQLPKLFEAGHSTDAASVAEIEEIQAEPFSEYYSYAESMVLLDGAWRMPDTAKYGDLTLGLLSVSADTRGGVPHINAAILEIGDQDGQSIFRVPEQVSAPYSKVIMKGRWSRSASPVESDEPSEIFASSERTDTSAPIGWAPFAWCEKRYRAQVRGLLFPEEVSSRSVGEGWVFAIRMQYAKPPRVSGGASNFGMRSTPPRQVERWQDMPTYLSRAGRAGQTDLAQRIPELAPLREARVLVFGAGCIGAPSILEFARSCIGELRLVDHDVVDPATTVRWPFGLAVAGQYKVRVLANLISEQYPYTTAVPSILRVGSVRTGGLSHRALLDDLLDGTSLVYDATADWAVQRFLSVEAGKRGIPYIAVSGTQGGWGGTVLRIRPGKTAGCWLCWRLNDSLSSPPSKHAENVQLAGCAEPTFTAAGFDMVEIAMQGVRVAVSTLCEGRDASYPSATWDFACISWRNQSGTALVPSIALSSIPRHPSCPVCTLAAAAPA